jgi:phage tail-like protein
MSSPTVLMASSFSISLQLDGSKDSVDGIFMGCDGFDFTQEVIRFKEVTNARWGKASKGRLLLTKLPGDAEGGNLTLRRGMSISMSMWKWFEAVQEGNWFKQRKTALITLHQEETPQATFEFTAAWPTRYRVGEMKTDSGDVELEEVEIAYEGFKRTEA